ncbi:hypothetical protein L1987_07937 [Smallanthus sonchifolius]|uniref:Uncharacterized protein n=1 Tax=Smallanthus sonchifolius TaxID=185202 RepID=A0ACB9JKZ5_9ASTR|nr:hypothetical protein L1987_07937 [Smallanthus sonchifolius]
MYLVFFKRWACVDKKKTKTKTQWLVFTSCLLPTQIKPSDFIPSYKYPFIHITSSSQNQLLISFQETKVCRLLQARLFDAKLRWHGRPESRW